MLGKIEGGGDDRGWASWMASPTQWTWVWASSGNCWWTGKLGVLQSMGWQIVGYAWTTELIVDLQCIGFRCTIKWFSYTHIYILSFSDFSPIWVVTEFENICFHLSPLLAYQLCSLVFLFKLLPWSVQYTSTRNPSTEHYTTSGAMWVSYNKVSLVCLSCPLYLCCHLIHLFLSYNHWIHSYYYHIEQTIKSIKKKKNESFSFTLTYSFSHIFPF